MSERIRFFCPTCSSKLRASVSLIGRTLDCPKCGGEITVRPHAPSEELPVLVFDDGAGSGRRSRWAGLD